MNKSNKTPKGINMLSYLIFGITYAFAAAVQPGPFQTYIISQTLNRGWVYIL